MKNRHIPFHTMLRPACTTALVVSASACTIPGPSPGIPPVPRCSRTDASARIGIQRGAGPDLPGLVSTRYSVTLFCLDEADQVVTAGGTFVDHQLSGPGVSPWIGGGLRDHDPRSTPSDLSFGLDGHLQGLWCVEGQVTLAGLQTLDFRYAVSERIDPPTNMPLAPAFLQRNGAGTLEVVAAGSFAQCL